MPPTTKEVLDGLKEMESAPIAPGWRGIAKSAFDEIERLQKRVRKFEFARRAAKFAVKYPE